MSSQWLLVLLFWVGSGQSLADSDKSIATFDLQRAVLQTQYASEKSKDIESQPEFKNNADQLKKLEVELKEMAEKFQKDRAVMTPEKQKEAVKRITDKENDAKYILSKLQQMQQEWMQQVMAEMGPNLQKVVEEIVTEKNIGLLLRTDISGGAVVFADDSYAITSLITERLNKIAQ